MSCSMIAKVRPWLRSPRIVCPSASVMAGLTPAVGSSRRISFGSSISAREISSSRFCPPERFLAGSLASSQRFTCSSKPRALPIAARSSAFTRPGCSRQRHSASPLWCGLASSMFSSTVSSPSSREIWKVRTRPMLARSSARRPRMLRPSKTTSPDSGTSSPPSTLKSVDLPAPFGPMMPVMLWRAISSEQPESASKPPNDLTRAFAVSIRALRLLAALELHDRRRPAPDLVHRLEQRRDHRVAVAAARVDEGELRGGRRAFPDVDLAGARRRAGELLAHEPEADAGLHQRGDRRFLVRLDHGRGMHAERLEQIRLHLLVRRMLGRAHPG